MSYQPTSVEQNKAWNSGLFSLHTLQESWACALPADQEVIPILPVTSLPVQASHL